MEKSKKSKINIILLSVLGVLIVAIIVVAVMLHNVNKKNEAAFNAKLHDFCVEHNLKISRDGTEFTVQIAPAAWWDSSAESQHLFCEVVYSEITTDAWDYHIMEEPFTPIVWFYVDNNKVASGAAGQITLD